MEAAQLRSLLAFGHEIDALVEDAQQRNLSVAETLALIMPILCARTGARGAWVRSFDESQALRTYRWPSDLVIAAEERILAATDANGGGAFAHTMDGEFVVAQPLDVAGEWFGSAALMFGASYDGDTEFLTQALAAACEEMDTFLGSVRVAREKHRVMTAFADALKSRVLADGLKQAVEIIAPAISADRLLLVCRASEGIGGEIHVLLFEGGRLTLDTMSPLGDAPTVGSPSATDVATIRSEASDYLAGVAPPLLARLRFELAQEETLIAGTTPGSVVGAIRLSTVRPSFTTRDGDLIAAFASLLRQRIVDFNKEWRGLAAHFRAEDIHRLLRREDYSERYLTPRVAQVAILFADISGFTRLSEGLLKDPLAIARLIEVWGQNAVTLIWAYGGVFDKMVGDCVIAFWGPPFYTGAPGHYIRQAVACAEAIRTMTAGIPAHAGFEVLREEGLGVSTGVNFAPICLGRFAPNGGFTGFSSGMNNTARLQSLACRDEILVMEDAISQLDDEVPALSFGEPREGRAKNVAMPLRFRPLISAFAPFSK